MMHGKAANIWKLARIARGPADQQVKGVGIERVDVGIALMSNRASVPWPSVFGDRVYGKACRDRMDDYVGGNSLRIRIARTAKTISQRPYG